jgi:hypothetical protein
MAYVYRHIRKDKNEPFYIGIGLTDDNFNRATAKAKRNNYWKNIVKVTDYTVQILFSDVSKEFALEKEKELIALYKRISDGGTLCNMTLGGEGTLGRKPANCRKIYALSPDNKVYFFNSLKEATSKTKCRNITYMTKAKSTTRDGWYFAETEEDLFKERRTQIVGKHKNHRKKSIVLTNGLEVRIFKSYTEAAKHINVFPNHIGDVVRGKLKQARGWKLLTENQ